jgi:hypothetical protein
MTTNDIDTAFKETREKLHDIGLEDEFFLDLVAARLLVERIGESDNMAWWDSRVLSSTGRARIEEVTPKTQLKSQINLATKVGRKAESDRAPDDAISLYSFGPQIESRLTATFDELQIEGSPEIEGLEGLSISSLEPGWTDEIIGLTATLNGDTSPASVEKDPVNGARKLNESGYVEGNIGSAKHEILEMLLEAYGESTDSITVPYFPLVSEIKSESA